MDDDFEYLRNLLWDLRKIGDSFEEGQEFLDRLQAYQTVGWPFGRKIDAFLMWVEFRQWTTVNWSCPALRIGLKAPSSPKRKVHAC